MSNESHLGDVVDDSGHRTDATPVVPKDFNPPPVAVHGNGHSGEPAPSRPAPTSIAGLDEVEWHTSYDRESVDRFLAEVEAEKARLTGEIAAAEAREEKARERLAAQKAYNEDQLGALVVSARTELDRIEKEHAEAVTAIRAAALEKAARILEAAHREASAVGDASASLTRVVRTDADAPGAHVPTATGRTDPDSEERTDVG